MTGRGPIHFRVGPLRLRVADDGLSGRLEFHDPTRGCWVRVDGYGTPASWLLTSEVRRLRGLLEDAGEELDELRRLVRRVAGSPSAPCGRQGECPCVEVHVTDDLHEELRAEAEYGG